MMGSVKQYARDLERVREELSKMLAQREDLETQIARTKRKVALLAQLCDETDELAPIPDLHLGGLTEACKTVLRATRHEWMTIAEIQVGLSELGFPLGKYKAPAASITTTVNRLVEAGEVAASSTNAAGAAAYRWLGIGNATPPLKVLASSLAQQKRRRRKI